MKPFFILLQETEQLNKFWKLVDEANKVSSKVPAEVWHGNTIVLKFSFKQQTCK